MKRFPKLKHRPDDTIVLKKRVHAKQGQNRSCPSRVCSSMGTRRSSSEAEREADAAHISPRVMEYVRQRSTCSNYVPPSFKFRVMLFADFEEVAILLHSSRAAVGETSRARRMNKPDPGGYIHAGRSYFVDDLLSSNAFWVEWFLRTGVFSTGQLLRGEKVFDRAKAGEKATTPLLQNLFHASLLGRRSPNLEKKGGAILLLFDRIYRIVIILPRIIDFSFF